MLTHPTSGPGMGHGLALSRRRPVRLTDDARILIGFVVVLVLVCGWPL